MVVVAAENQIRSRFSPGPRNSNSQSVGAFGPEAHVGWSVGADPNPVNTRFDTLAFEAHVLKSHLNMYIGLFYV